MILILPPLLETTQQTIATTIADFLHGKISRDTCKTQLTSTKEHYLTNAPRGSEKADQSLLPVEQILLKGIHLPGDRVEMRDFSTLLSRLAHRQKQQTLQSQIDKQLLTTLTITDATTEARGLGIQIIQLDEVILPPDEIPFPISEGGGRWSEKPLGYHKVTPLIEAITHHFQIDPTDSTYCQGYTGSVDAYTSRHHSYLVLTFPTLGVSLYIHNAYGQGVYVIDGIVDEDAMTQITKQGRQSLQPSPNNPSKFPAYHISDPLRTQHDLARRTQEIIEKITSIMMKHQGDETDIPTTTLPAPSLSREVTDTTPADQFADVLTSTEELTPTQIFEYVLRTEGYDRLMGWDKQQINDFNIQIGEAKFSIKQIATRLGNDNTQGNPQIPVGFQKFITRYFDQIPLQVVFNHFLTREGYDQLMGWTHEQINDFNIQIGEAKFSIKQIATRLGNDNAQGNPQTPVGFQEFITTYFKQTPIQEVFEKTLQEIGYEKLMGWTAQQINDFNIQIGEAKFSIQQIATRLGNDNKAWDPQSPTGFQEFITTYFKQTPIQEVFEKTLQEIGYEKLMGWTTQQIINFNIQIGEAKFGISEITTRLGNDNKQQNPITPVGFQEFITTYFKQTPIQEVFEKTLQEIGYEQMMGWTQQQINDFKIQIGTKKFGIERIATRLGNDNTQRNPKTPTGFQKFIHFIVYKKTQEAYAARSRTHRSVSI